MIARPRQPRYVQPMLDSLGTPLRDVTFVVLDLETTGGAPDGSGITEVGAVKVCGGEQVGEFATLVNPGMPIPPFITVLTGITEAMVLPAPTIDSVLPALLEFLDGSVFVAHNAPYDSGFLKAACAQHGYTWPNPRILDTAALARRVLTDDEVPNHKLSTLAQYFKTSTRPVHRALDDARATVDVLHSLIGRLGSHKIFTLDEAIEFMKALSPAQRAKRYLAENLPDSPGVYIFRDAKGRPLYVGTSNSISTRVRSYFTASETRKRISEMLHVAERVEAIECAHSLEAEVRELRLIAANKPPYNRRSKFPERAVWLKLTAEAYPRLSLVGRVRADGADYLGPFGSKIYAELAASAILEVTHLRQCTRKLSARRASPACALAELGRCAAPCELSITVDEYAHRCAQPFRAAVAGDPGTLVSSLLARIDRLAGAQRFEDAARLRMRLVALLRASIRMQRLVALTSMDELVAARQEPKGGWELAVVRYGRLAAAGTAKPGVPPRETLAMLLASAETVRPGPGPAPSATAEESERIINWLERPEVRLVQATGGWAYPVGGAARFAELLAQAEAAPGAADPLHEGDHRPARRTRRRFEVRTRGGTERQPQSPETAGTWPVTSNVLADATQPATVPDAGRDP